MQQTLLQVSKGLHKSRTTLLQVQKSQQPGDTVCVVSDHVMCPDGSGAMCSGDQCCPGGSTCPSASSVHYDGCSTPKIHDCTAASSYCGNGATFNPSAEDCVDTEIGGVVCPRGHSVCFGNPAFMGGTAHNPHCYNPETHQCLVYGYPGDTQAVCALGEEVCGGVCHATGTGSCCGGTMNQSPKWLAASANRQCCTGRCQRGCEIFDCDATTEECIHFYDADWSEDNPLACRAAITTNSYGW